MTRGSRAVVIVPNAGEPRTPLGAPQAGVFVTLKASIRSSSREPAGSATWRMRARSRFRCPGPRTGLREAVPRVNCGAAANAAVSNHRAVERAGG